MKIITKKKVDEIMKRITANEIIGIEYIKDIEYWRDVLSSSKDFELLECRRMETDDEAWNDWLKEENEYAIGDRKSMESGAGDYLCFIMAVLEKK